MLWKGEFGGHCPPTASTLPTKGSRQLYERDRRPPCPAQTRRWSSSSAARRDAPFGSRERGAPSNRGIKHPGATRLIVSHLVPVQAARFVSPRSRTEIGNLKPERDTLRKCRQAARRGGTAKGGGSAQAWLHSPVNGDPDRGLEGARPCRPATVSAERRPPRRPRKMPRRAGASTRGNGRERCDRRSRGYARCSWFRLPACQTPGRSAAGWSPSRI